MKEAVLSIPVQKTNFLVKAFLTQAKGFEENRYGMMVVYMLVQSCLGSVACMYLLQSFAPIAVLLPCAMVTMLCNAILIAQSSAKLTVGSVNLSLLVNTIYILAYIA